MSMMDEVSWLGRFNVTLAISIPYSRLAVGIDVRSSSFWTGSQKTQALEETSQKKKLCVEG
jgi:hypothetical protein